MAMLELAIVAAAVLAAGEPTYPQARRCSALLDVAWPEEPDEARKQVLLAAAVDWGRVSGELARKEGRTDRQFLMTVRDDADRAEIEWESTDPKIREALLKEIEQCLADKPERAA
jgi:hypothetical protein